MGGPYALSQGAAATGRTPPASPQTEIENHELKDKYLAVLKEWIRQQDKIRALELENKALHEQLGRRLVNNPRGLNNKKNKGKGRSKSVPPASPRRKATREDDPRGVRTTPSKKGGWGAPLAGSAAGLMPSPPVATTTRARTQFGTEGLRDLAKEFVGQ